MQIAFSFDRKTLKKIGKGSLISMGAALTTYLAANIDQINQAIHASPLVAALITALAGIGINIIKEWIAGQNQKLSEENGAQVQSKVSDIVDDIKVQAQEEVSREIEKNNEV